MKTGIVITYTKKQNTIDFNELTEVLYRDFSYYLCFVLKSEDYSDELAHFQNQHPYNVHVIKLKTWKSNCLATQKGVHYFYNRKDISYIGLLGEDSLLNIDTFDLLKSSIQANNAVSIALQRSTMCSTSITSETLLKKVQSELCLRVLKFRTGVSLKGVLGGKKLFARSIVPIIFGEDAVTFKSDDFKIFVRLKYYLGKKNLQQHYCIL